MRKLCLLFLLIMSMGILYAQTSQPKTVTGTVTDETGEVLIGVSVVLKGTTTGVITDASGVYSIRVPGNDAVLVYSFVGMEPQEVTVGDRTVIDVTMESDVLTMDEVVVVGYGSIKKTDLTGSVGSVASENIVNRGSTAALEALQGQVAGVNISRSNGRANVGFDITIRGQNSIAGGSPLYVVDGLVVENIDFLNPNDIARMDILKDASSTAIYGSRGSNGVVIISTKGAGEAISEKVSVTYDGYYGVRTPAHEPRMMTGEEWFNYRMAASQGNETEPFAGDIFGGPKEIVPVSADEWAREMTRSIEAGVI